MRPFCLWFFVTVDYVFVTASDSCMLVLNTESIDFWLANTMITIILWNLSSGIKYLLIKVKHSCMHLTTLDFNFRVLWIPCCSSLRTPWNRDELVMLLTVATYSQHFTGHILYWSQIDNVNNTIKYYWVHKSLSLHVYCGVLNANSISSAHTRATRAVTGQRNNLGRKFLDPSPLWQVWWETRSLHWWCTTLGLPSRSPLSRSCWRWGWKYISVDSE